MNSIVSAFRQREKEKKKKSNGNFRDESFLVFLATRSNGPELLFFFNFPQEKVNAGEARLSFFDFAIGKN